MDQKGSSIMEPILKARGLVKRYGRVVALDHCDFDLMPGEILAVIGDNGAGKSSLIKAISGAVQPDAGTVTLEGKEIQFASPIDARHAGIETVYQTLAMSPALSIADNMFMGREIRKPGLRGSLLRQLDRKKMEEIAREKLSELGLMTIQNINQAVETLSGGQRQGVAVARAAAFGSKVIILDEPTAALGVKESRRVLELIQDVTFTRHSDYPDQPQHATCVRGGRPHPRTPFGKTPVRDRPQRPFNGRRGCIDDRGQGT
jgi:fructose transport system ATP-binding protein